MEDFQGWIEYKGMDDYGCMEIIVYTVITGMISNDSMNLIKEYN